MPAPPRQPGGTRGQPPRPGAPGKAHPGRTRGSPPAAVPAVPRLTQARAHGRTDGRTDGRPLSPRLPLDPRGAAVPRAAAPRRQQRPARPGPAGGGRRAPLAPYLSGVLGSGSRFPPQPRRGSGRPALLLLGRAAAQRRRYRNWLRLEETPASGGREAGAGRRCGVRSEPFIQEYPGLFLLLLRLQPAPGTAQPGRRLGGRLAALTSVASSD